LGDLLWHWFYIVNLTKTWLGDFLGYFSLSLGYFLTKTSGHPAWFAQKSAKMQKIISFETKKNVILLSTSSLSHKTC
jgi:hypothetical protein